eukprot:1160827-Pelagomonas_calceolata.AAC.5
MRGSHLVLEAKVRLGRHVQAGGQYLKGPAGEQQAQGCVTESHKRYGRMFAWVACAGRGITLGRTCR